MIGELLRHYEEVVLFDTEFGCPDGGRAEPLCLVYRELGSGRLGRVWLDVAAPAVPPCPFGIERTPA